MAPDNKRRLSSDGSTPKPSDKTVKPASNGNNGKGESTDRNVFSNAPPPAHSNTVQPAWVDQLKTVLKVDKLYCKYLQMWTNRSQRRRIINPLRRTWILKMRL
jgi:hypothetical protein